MNDHQQPGVHIPPQHQPADFGPLVLMLAVMLIGALLIPCASSCLGSTRKREARQFAKDEHQRELIRQVLDERGLNK